ncbi:chromosomal replication initiator protein DnaA [Pseudobacteriovorax antillogorgiicola]|uniref:Chromosomal replication initiator protein DnaA n=1 Tax=Pseudobacteriovorax antillogorgiicola TaxID=1513793 RepID=A0A1Y6B5A3_9BACT|nr:chromosomal replication initiator protein DnaA [Pseudobacteriovorax antillogorgiicola]TCS59146.1 chromosomal replication initiator protein DnaA [Pseudobacteriovorax antillogorgiicola]SME91248.1 chromosomal replication initiator protein DnaA [Pseudobacteriovorax antillogorgiicola]
MQTLFPPESGESNESSKNLDPKQSPWLKIKQQLKELIEPDEFDKWIAPLDSKSHSDDEVVISLPDMTSYQVILDRFIDQFDYCKATLGLQVFFRFEIEGTESTASEVFEDDSSTLNELLSHNEVSDPDPQPDYTREPSSPVSRALTHHSQLNTEYTFQNFVNGPSNQFAHASCLAVADAPGQHYNPLFLYGSTGLGKTHLLHAVGNKVLKVKENAVITYITSERFMNEMIYCLRFNKMWDFRRKYRNCDVLLVDDIQFISGKERTQEEFFHTFNALYEAKKQIVVTSDIFPQDIPDIEDRLRNRFQWGLIADIQPPDIEHRVAILMNKADKQGVPLSQHVAEYIANHAKGNVRVLEGALRRVAAFAALQGVPIDIELASQILQDVLGDTGTKNITIESIQKIVAEHFKVRVADLKSKKRQRAFSIPRQIAMFLSRNRTQSSFPEIGAGFGGKDHTTVMHAVKKIEQDKKRDIEVKTHIEAIERKLDQLH